MHRPPIYTFRNFASGHAEDTEIECVFYITLTRARERQTENKRERERGARGVVALKYSIPIRKKIQIKE